MDRITWIDRLRGMAILLVLFFHSTSLQRYGYEIPAELQSLNSLMSPFRMATLAFLAGVVSPLSLGKKGFAYFEGKVKYLLWPYVIWTIIYYYTAGSIYSFFDHEVYISYLWYLPFLIFCYFVLYYSNFVSDLVMICCFITISIIIPAEYDAPQRVFFLGGIFFLGKMFVDMKIIDWIFNLSRSNWLALFVVMVTASVASFFGERVRYSPEWFLPVTCGIIFFVKCASQLDGKYSSVKFLEYIGRNSIVFYVFHFPYIYIMVKFLSNYNFSVYLSILIVFLSSIFIGCLLTYLKDRFIFVSMFFALPKFRFS
jgi:uncharacterized membrane protein YcfT